MVEGEAEGAREKEKAREWETYRGGPHGYARSSAARLVKHNTTKNRSVFMACSLQPYLLARQLFQFRPAANNPERFAIRRLPNRQRGAPKSGPADCPVVGCFQPIVEPFSLHLLRHPVGLLVGAYQP